ncbi:DUF1254 domain-containing protein [Flavobacterium aquicola]|uniref:Uncharacterized protein DUF1254 n=1 Tax=Flavobacterium aquicola TaxID=1682742 RepID=A0A3E0EQQ8_9FLAO|nr:DUF1254 domain-containing protein [Flavobacterium aquicola]REH00479.1 uncharacterized protein DUF1254 [Flavobacterium aquicola]
MSTTKNITRKGIYGVAVVLLAVVFYYLTIWVTPYYVQNKIASQRSPDVNTLRFAKRPSPENNRVVPLPNPDFLYSSINYDIKDSVLKITGKVPDSTYWSIAAYQSNTTNFFVANDSQADGNFEYYLAEEGSTSALLKDIPKEKIIYSPTASGLILFRYLISKAYPFNTLVDLQHSVKAEKLAE